MCVRSKSLLLHKHCSWSPSWAYARPLTEATTTVCPDPQLLGLHAPQQPLHSLWVSHNISPGPHSCCCCRPKWSGPTRHHASLTWSSCSHTGCPVLSITSTGFPPPTGEDLSLLKSVHKVWKRQLLLKVHRHLSKATGITGNQGNTTPPKEYDISPGTGPKPMEDYPQEGRTPQVWSSKKRDSYTRQPRYGEPTHRR